MKSNKTYQPPSSKREIIYLVCMAFFAVATLFFDHPIIAAAEGGMFLLLLGYTLFARNREAKKLSRYIESITYDTENAKNSTLLSFPLPMAVFRLADSSIVWGNDAFFRMLGDQDSRLNARLVSLIPDFSGKWLMEGKTQYPALVEVQGRKYQLHGNLIRSEKEEEASAIMGISYWLDVTDYDNTRILYEQSRPVPGVVVIDNLDEMTRNYPERVRNELRDSVEDRLRQSMVFCAVMTGIASLS